MSFHGYGTAAFSASNPTSHFNAVQLPKMWPWNIIFPYPTQMWTKWGKNDIEAGYDDV